MTTKTVQGRFRLHPMAAACALMMFGLAHAQQADTTSDDAKAKAEAKKKTDAEMTVVTVAGIRRGIEEAISIKKNSSSIVEAISAEDIGKLPDNTVAESISRLSGVTTQRNKVNGKATDVSVRGLSPSFNGSLLNGREQASTSDARSPEFDLFPSELTGSVLVYKTPDASLMGQGLASTIDLRTLRPLDFGKRVLAASAKKERIGVDSGSDLGSGHRATLTYVDQFANRTIGLSLGLTKFKEDNGGELKFDSWGGWAPTLDYNGAQVAVPGGFLAEISRRKSDRDGASLTLQYKPNQNFKSTVDVFYSRGDESTKKTGIEGAVAFGTGPYDPNGVLTNAVVSNGIASSGTISNYKADVRNHLYSNEDRLASFGWNNELKLDDKWRVETDLSHSHGVKNISNYETTAGQPGNTPASQLGSISFSGFNGTNFADVKYKTSLDYSDRKVALLTDVDGWGGGPNSPQAGYVSLPNIDDTVNSVRLTAHRELEWGPLASATFGINYTKRDKSRTGQEGRLSIKGGDGYASAAMPGTDVAPAGASGLMVASFDPTGTLGTIYDLNRWVDATVLSRDWSVGEKVATAYAMADLDGTLMSLPYTGNFGLQVVNTKQQASGNQVDLARCTGITFDTCPYSVRTGGASYTNVLPSMNVAFDLGGEQKLRLGAGKQISRANLDNMKASLDFAVQNATSVAPALTGFAGNPELKPYQARSLDLSYEKYFGKKGYISVASFFKKLDNYIINAPELFDFKPYTSANTPLPTTGPYAGSTVGFLTKPQNGSGGNMHGYEVAVNVPFSLVTPWLDGFGVAANYSFTDSSVKLPTSGFVSPQNGPVFKDSVSEIGLPGLSKNVSSLRLYYENNGVQLAWAAHRRSSFVGQILDYRSDSQFTFIKGETIVDLQASYEFQSGWLKGVSVFLQGHNWTNTPFREYASDPNLITNTVVYGRTYTAGVNVKF
ncbi:TonB-dependent receptor [Duganella sp. LjRoot269]|uniref:TonB-dependent receptor n=1 Tax=Duganella sp. LjRoot269 TaxID=3342305 RepID=UPI003ED1186C